MLKNSWQSKYLKFKPKNYLLYLDNMEIIIYYLDNKIPLDYGNPACVSTSPFKSNCIMKTAYETS